jgi:hypothetical protein
MTCKEEQMGTGDFKTDEFSKEELTALGEAEAAPAAEKAEPAETEPEPEANPEGEVAPEEKPETELKPEPTPEELAAAEDQGFRIETDEKGHTYIIDEDGERIPPKRFREVYREAKEGERTKEKFDLFKKLGPEGYYQAYPDERPAERPAPEPQRETIPPDADIGSLIVKQPDGPYDGMTLRDVYGVDPVFATNLQTDFRMQQRLDIEKQRGEQDRVKMEAATEIESFANDISKDLFGKESKALSKDEDSKIAETIQTVLGWMSKTHRGGGNIADAYFLMNKEGLLKGAASKAAAATIKNLQDRKGPASIDTGKGGEVKETGFEAMEKMTEADLTKKIDGMSDKDAAKFFKTAPKALRAKYPGLPWD